jgi:phage gp36-like protein
VDIAERLGGGALVQLADDNGDGVADTAVVDEARLGAEGEVNSYLARQYSTPIDLTVHPELADLLASVTLDIAEDRLRSRRPPVAEDAVRRIAQTRIWLQRVAAGEAELPAWSPVSVSTLRGTVATSFGEDRLLSRDELADY